MALQVIIRERPYAVMMYPEFTESHCHLCFRGLEEVERIPCKGCDKVRGITHTHATYQYSRLLLGYPVNPNLLIGDFFNCFGLYYNGFQMAIAKFLDCTEIG